MRKGLKRANAHALTGAGSRVELNATKERFRYSNYEVAERLTGAANAERRAFSCAAFESALSQEAQLVLENSLPRRYEALFRVAQAVAAYRDPKELFGASETMWTSFVAAWTPASC